MDMSPLADMKSMIMSFHDLMTSDCTCGLQTAHDMIECYSTKCPSELDAALRALCVPLTTMQEAWVPHAKTIAQSMGILGFKGATIGLAATIQSTVVQLTYEIGMAFGYNDNGNFEKSCYVAGSDGVTTDWQLADLDWGPGMALFKEYGQIPGYSLTASTTLGSTEIQAIKTYSDRDDRLSHEQDTLSCLTGNLWNCCSAASIWTQDIQAYPVPEVSTDASLDVGVSRDYTHSVSLP